MNQPVSRLLPFLLPNSRILAGIGRYQPRGAFEKTQLKQS